MTGLQSTGTTNRVHDERHSKAFQLLRIDHRSAKDRPIHFEHFRRIDLMPQATSSPFPNSTLPFLSSPNHPHGKTDNGSHSVLPISIAILTAGPRFGHVFSNVSQHLKTSSTPVPPRESIARESTHHDKLDTIRQIEQHRFQSPWKDETQHLAGEHRYSHTWPAHHRAASATCS